jgi:glycosidase
MLKKRSHLFPLYLLLFTMPGVPSIYYGSEWGIEGKKAKDNDYDLRPALNMAQLSTGKGSDLYDAVKKLIGLRKKHVSLRCGDYRQIYTEHNQLIFLRESETEKIIVAINSSDKKVAVEFKMPFQCKRIYDVLNDEEIIVTGMKQKFELYPNWGRVMEII